MITFMNERINLETKYATALHNLAKNGSFLSLFKLMNNRWSKQHGTEYQYVPFYH